MNVGEETVKFTEGYKLPGTGFTVAIERLTQLKVQHSDLYKALVGSKKTGIQVGLNFVFRSRQI